MQAGVGFATHSGWAIAVTAGTDNAGQLRVVDRRRVALVDDDLPRQAYHAAAELDATAGEELVARVEASIVARAGAALREILHACGDASVQGIGVVGEPRPIPAVAEVLASHARMHACEGEQYRRGIVEAANDLGVAVMRIGPIELSRLGRVLRWDADRTQRELAAVRAQLGPPWQADHKQAALAALAAHRL
jgi:hypothetical protein